MNKVVYKIVSVANTVPALYLVCFLVLVYAPLITLCYTAALLFIDLVRDPFIIRENLRRGSDNCEGTKQVLHTLLRTA